jgi:hypothetical protein
MVKRPADFNPENFIDGKGEFLIGRPAVAYGGPREFRIDPAPVRPFPTFNLVATNIVFVLFFAGFAWFCVTHNDSGVNEFAICAGTTAVGLMTCVCSVGFSMYGRWLGASELARGPWLRYDKVTRRVELSRQRLTFEFSEIVHLQYVSTARIDRPRSVVAEESKYARSELNLVTIRGGKRERWNLVNSMWPSGAFEEVLDHLIEQTPVPVVRITETAGPWKVWIRPYCDLTKPASTAAQAERLGGN